MRSSLIACFSALALFAVGLTSCASISLKYESDVRFERCYALDWKQDVDPGIRGRCWEEWLTHYATGQTQDRIQYARRQAGGAGVMPLAALSASASATPVSAPLPEPTSVFSPVPMMVTSATSSASASAASASAPTRTSCETRCDKTLEACLSGCGSAVCERYCSQKHGKCTGKCEPAAKGG